MIKEKKHTGSYYTPPYLANFITKRVLNHFDGRKRLSVLEPSIGDGSFVDELKASDIDLHLTGIDIDGNELNAAKNKWHTHTKSLFLNCDFLEYTSSKNYSAIIGNPPYVKKSFLNTDQLQLSKEIYRREGIAENSFNNIWSAFLIKSCAMLSSNGVLAFVLPSELLQVKFAEEIREYLKNQFQRIEIFTFSDLMFECKGQDTIVLFAYKKHYQAGEYFVNIPSKDALEQNDFILKKNNLLVDSKVKWTHHFLNDSELNVLNTLKTSLRSINSFCKSVPGIVTAANKFFIVNREIEEKFNLSKFTQPIVQKGYYVNGSVVFDENSYEALEKKYPSRLLQLSDSDKITSNLQKYLNIGMEQNIHERYKCKQRAKWYVVPNIATSPEAFFFKRSHFYPKLIKNSSKSLVTDSAYKINIREGYDLNSLIFSFYNSLTLAFSEIEGRYYGGGVLELTPTEFRGLPLPYTSISNKEFEVFVRRFEHKETIEDVLEVNDKVILKETLNLSYSEISKIQNIRRKLIAKRIR
jgi:adenine-specific DNA-methyltransferase